MAGETPITLVGNLTADPELRYTSQGTPVAGFTVASTPRRYNSQTQQWEDGQALFVRCNLWRQPGENFAHTCRKGMRVIVTGRLVQHTWETREGEKRHQIECEVEEAGPSLKYATAQVSKTSGNGGGGGQWQQSGTQQGRGSQQGASPWEQTPATPGGHPAGRAGEEQPPF